MSSCPPYAVSAALAEAPIVARVTRGGVVESVHHGSVVVTDPGGRASATWGDADAPILPRSSNKPLQALAMLRHGLALPPRLLALACASHSAEPFHLSAVREILHRAGLDETDLQNTPDLPYDDDERSAWIAAGRSARSLAQNCSGKHAAMLLTCLANDWPLDTYRQPDHPLQVAMAETISELAGEPIAATEVDGCGAPVMAISLTGLARAFGRLASATGGTPEQEVADAMRGYPDHVAGTRRDATAVMRAIPGAIAKDGAEAVYAVGLADGRGIALKIADGGIRARGPVLAAVLRSLGLGHAAYELLEGAPILGHGRPVGRVEAVGF